MDGGEAWANREQLERWIGGVDLQAERTRATTTHTRWIELHFYAIALNQVIRGAKWAERELDGEAQKRVTAALAAFDAAAPDANAVRGILEHEIAYDSGADINGKPKWRKDVPTPTPRCIVTEDGNVEVTISSNRGGNVSPWPYVLNVSSATVAAHVLADAVIAELLRVPR
jgi:hypothetical protein